MYCDQIRERDPAYRPRRATHALGSPFPRCDYHWRFVCDCCARPRIFHGIAYCPRRDAMVCVECSPAERAVRRRFWAWSYYFSLRCPWHTGFHPALDRLEHEGRHPWQLRPGDFRRRRWMSPSDEIPLRWTTRVGPTSRVSDATVRKGWDDVAGWWVERYTEKGDINREWVIDPALLAIVGDVRGQRIFSITHPAFDIPPAHWVREPPDSDRAEERPFIAVDRYFDRVALYWGPSGQPELVGFHRPLRDFTEGLRQAGFVIVRLEEPRPLPEAIRRRYRQFADQLRIPNFLMIEARKA